MKDLFGDTFPPDKTEFDHRNLGAKNLGCMLHRTQWNDLEKVLARKWHEENKPRPGTNYGQGILQDLFITGGDNIFTFPRVFHHVTNLERFVAATVIQWIGTNCGLGFLREALREVGLHILEINPESWEAQCKQYGEMKPQMKLDPLPKPNPYTKRKIIP